MGGNVTVGCGIPLIHQTLDGNTADCTWNGNVFGELKTLLKDRLSETVYIADCKLMTMPNIKIMNEHKVQFISRVPDSFQAKLAAKLKAEAYEYNEWQDLGKVKDDDHHASYEGCSFIRQVDGMDLRFLVVKSSDGKVKFDKKLQREKDDLDRAIRELEKQQFSCEPDAEKSSALFKKNHGKGFYKLSFEITSSTTEKRAVGNPGKNPKPPEIITTWQIRCSYCQDEQKLILATQKAESFILVTNVPEKSDIQNKFTLHDAGLLYKYKEQHAVENGFRILKDPAMAATIFLKKPERIQALMMLLHVALAVRLLIQREARLRLEDSKQELRDTDNRKVESITVERLMNLLYIHHIITIDGKNYLTKTAERDHKRMLLILDLLGICEQDLLSA
jgi:transposase